MSSASPNDPPPPPRIVLDFKRTPSAPRERAPRQNQVTLALIAVNVVMLGVSYAWGAHNEALYRLGSNNIDTIHRSELYRLFAAAFLHADVVHCLVNMIALYSFGPLVEVLLGPRRYLALYAASALGGSLASLAGSVADPLRSSVGASGAIWGVMAAGLGIALRPRGLIPPHIASAMQRSVVVPLVVNVAYSLQPRVDMLGHLGGGVTGLALTAALLTRDLTPMAERAVVSDAERTPRGWLHAIAIGAVLAMGASIALGVARGRPWELAAAPSLRRVALEGTSLSIEVPSTIAGNVSAKPSQNAQIITFGDLRSSSMIVEVIAARFDTEVKPNEVGAVLDQLLDDMNESGPKGSVKKGPAARINLGDRQAIEVHHSASTVSVSAYMMVFDRNQVVVRTYTRNDAPSSWASLGRQIAASVR